MKWIKYFKIDCRRMVLSFRFWGAVMLIPCILLFAVFEDISFESDVFGIFSIVMYSIPSVLILLCGTLVFATGFCEDMEHKYIIQQTIRGNIKSYVMARIISIFMGALIVTAFGLFLYAWILHIWLPWTGVSGIYEDWLEAGGFKVLLETHHYGLYFLLYGIQYGAMVGILALWASYISLFVSNSMLVLSFPLIGYYFFDKIYAVLFPELPGVSLLFTLSFNLFQNERMEILIIIGISLVHIVLLSWLFTRQIRRRYYE